MYAGDTEDPGLAQPLAFTARTRGAGIACSAPITGKRWWEAANDEYTAADGVPEVGFTAVVKAVFKALFMPC